MIITYYGRQFFKVQYGSTTIAINPISKDAKGEKASRFGSDIALVTTNNPLYNGIEQVGFGENNPFIVNGPGEYEVKDIFIKGVKSAGSVNGKEILNTVYSFEIDGITVCFMGAIAEGGLTSEVRGGIPEVDVLFVPISGNGVMTPAEAYKSAVSLEPSIIVPIDYDEKTLAEFMKEAGEKKTEKVDKLTIKKKDLEGKEGEVVVFSAE